MNFLSALLDEAISSAANAAAVDATTEPTGAIRLSLLSERKYPDKDAEISEWVVEEHVDGLKIEPYKEQAQE